MECYGDSWGNEEPGYRKIIREKMLVGADERTRMREELKAEILWEIERKNRIEDYGKGYEL